MKQKGRNGRIIRNATKGVVLAETVEVANTFLTRLRGLLGRKEFREGEALIIDPCNSVHTIGMRFSIDVLFLDRENRVIGLRRGISPNRMTSIFWNSRRVVELPDSSIEASPTAV